MSMLVYLTYETCKSSAPDAYRELSDHKIIYAQKQMC